MCKNLDFPSVCRCPEASCNQESQFSPILNFNCKRLANKRLQFWMKQTKYCECGFCGQSLKEGVVQIVFRLFGSCTFLSVLLCLLLFHYNNLGFLCRDLFFCISAPSVAPFSQNFSFSFLKVNRFY